jgi:hypothetical protein
MELKPLLAALVTTTALVLSGCSVPAAPAALAAPAPTASAPTTAATDSPTQTAIDGAWPSRLTRAQITSQLKAAGLAKWTQPFLKREATPATLTGRWLTHDDSRPDKVWSWT